MHRRANGGPVCWVTLAVASVLLLPPAGACGAPPAESFLRGLPPGVYVRDSQRIPANQTAAIGRKLGGNIKRLTNSQLQVHGRPIQVNAITAANAAGAGAIYQTMLKAKQPPYVLRNGLTVIEYVGNRLDAAVAIKTSYELGFVAKPKRVRYRVRAELATIDEADYMSCNPLFNLFLAERQRPNAKAARQIDELAAKFTFGRTLALRAADLGAERSKHTFEPATTQAEESHANAEYTFANLPDLHGVPFATADLEITVDESGVSKSSQAPAADMTAATAYWPVDDPQVRELANRITKGKTTNRDKAQAILEWLRPGKNIDYSGRTGSRWGTAKVLEQKFGHCWDFSDCFVTLCRAAGVPARQVAGWLYGTSGHVWAEYYQEGAGWQQVDPTGGGVLNCGIYHIPYFTTEDGEMPIVYLSIPQIEVVKTE